MSGLGRASTCVRRSKSPWIGGSSPSMALMSFTPGSARQELALVQATVFGVGREGG